MRAQYSTTQRRQPLGPLPARGEGGSYRAAIGGDASFILPYVTVRGPPRAAEIIEGGVGRRRREGTAAGAGGDGAGAGAGAGARSDRLAIGVWDQESLMADRPLGVGTIHLSDVLAERWGSWAWLNIYGDGQQLPSAFTRFVEKVIPQAMQVGHRRRWGAAGEDQANLMNHGTAPGTALTGRLLIRLLSTRVPPPGLQLSCCAADGGCSAPVAGCSQPAHNPAGLSPWAAAIGVEAAAKDSAAGGDLEQPAVAGYRIRALVLQAGSLPGDGHYAVEISCGTQAVHTPPLALDANGSADACSVSYWAAGHIELEPLQFLDFAPGESVEATVVPDLSQLPDIFVSLYRGDAAVQLGQAQKQLGRCRAKEAEAVRRVAMVAESDRRYGLDAGKEASLAVDRARAKTQAAHAKWRECRKARLSFSRVDPRELDSELTLEAAQWRVLVRDPFGGSDVGTFGGTVLVSVAAEPVFDTAARRQDRDAALRRRGQLAVANADDIAAAAVATHRAITTTSPRRGERQRPGASAAELQRSPPPRPHPAVVEAMLGSPVRDTPARGGGGSAVSPPSTLGVRKRAAQAAAAAAAAEAETRSQATAIQRLQFELDRTQKARSALEGKRLTRLALTVEAAKGLAAGSGAAARRRWPCFVQVAVQPARMRQRGAAPILRKTQAVMWEGEGSQRSLSWEQTFVIDMAGDPAAASFTCEVYYGTEGGLRKSEPILICATELISLRRIAEQDGGRARAWFPLYEPVRDSESGNRRGQLALSFSLNPPVDAEETASQIVALRASELDLEKQIRACKEQQAAGVAARTEPRQLTPRSHHRSWHGQPELVEYELCVHVYQARGLPPADDTGRANPVVRIDSPVVGPATVQTEVASGVLSPRWYESFFLPMMLPHDRTLVRLWAPQLVLTLFHREKSVVSSRREKLLGWLRLTLDEGQPSDSPASLRLNDDVPEHRSVPRDDVEREAPEPQWHELEHIQHGGETDPVGNSVPLQPVWLLLSYELLRGPSRQRLPFTLPLREATYTVWVLALGCRGLRPGSKLGLAVQPQMRLSVPGLMPDDSDQAQQTLQPEPGGDGANPSFCFRPDAEQHAEEHTKAGDTVAACGIVKLQAFLPDAARPAPFGYVPVVVAEVRDHAGLGASTVIGTATIELASYMSSADPPSEDELELSHTPLRGRYKQNAKAVSRTRGASKAGQKLGSAKQVARTQQNRLFSARSLAVSERVDTMLYAGVARDSVEFNQLAPLATSQGTSISDTDMDDNEADDDDGAAAAPVWDWLGQRRIYQHGQHCHCSLCRSDRGLGRMDEATGCAAYVTSFPLHRGSAVGEHGGVDAATTAACGVFKAALCVVPTEDPSELARTGRGRGHGPPQSLVALRDQYATTPRKVMVYCYIIRATHVEPKDASGKSDPYLAVRLLGGKKLRPVKREGGSLSQEQTLNPYFGQLY
jgi:hypothetical protein